MQIIQSQTKLEHDPNKKKFKVICEEETYTITSRLNPQSQ